MKVTKKPPYVEGHTAEKLIDRVINACTKLQIGYTCCQYVQF